MRLPAALMYLTVQLLSQQLLPCETLQVAAFSIEKFGADKRKDPNFMGPLTTVYKDAQTMWGYFNRCSFVWTYNYGKLN